MKKLKDGLLKDNQIVQIKELMHDIQQDLNNLVSTIAIYLSIYLLRIFFKAGQTIITRLIKTNLTKANTDIINKNVQI